MNFVTLSLCRSRRCRGGFTLVEILVVIAIIAILAAAFLVAGGSAINAAKRAKANVMATQLQAAILNYQTEYGVYPVASGTATDTIYALPSSGYALSAAESPLMIALCGNINTYTATATASTIPNTRQIAYLTPKRSDVDSGGVLLNPFSSVSASTYYYFGIAMDSDYSGILGDTGSAAPPNFSTWTVGTAQSATTAANVTQGVAVWACCDTTYLNTPGSSKTPGFWIHTY